MNDNKHLHEQESPAEIEKEKHVWAGLIVFLTVIIICLGTAAYFIIADYYGHDNGLTRSFGEFKDGLYRLTGEGSDEGPDNGLVRRSIDGVYVATGTENIFPAAVMIDNHPDARPPLGLSRANMVFEAEVEGVTTRFLAFYADERGVEEIGPVRSVRPYFIDWAHEFSALLAHCGGSPQALVKIARENILDMNEYYKGQYFWRTKNRLSPHNLLTSVEQLRSYLDSKDYVEGKYFTWQFKDDIPPVDGLGDDIVIPEFMVRWEYEADSNDYARWQSGRPHTDADGDRIRAKNVIISFNKTQVIDSELRLKIETTGTGTSIACFDGSCIRGEWRKPNVSSRTRFYDTDGHELVFNAGTTWIEVVRPGYEVGY